jgi:hypothetical protein
MCFRALVFLRQVSLILSETRTADMHEFVHISVGCVQIFSGLTGPDERFCKKTKQNTEKTTKTKTKQIKSKIGDASVEKSFSGPPRLRPKKSLAEDVLGRGRSWPRTFLADEVWPQTSGRRNLAEEVLGRRRSWPKKSGRRSLAEEVPGRRSSWPKKFLAGKSLAEEVLGRRSSFPKRSLFEMQSVRLRIQSYMMIVVTEQSTQFSRDI